MGELAPDLPAALLQVREAARVFAAGRDGRALLPPELCAPVERWQENLRSAGEVLDLEAWLLGLLTLASLSRRDPVPRAQDAQKTQNTGAEKTCARETGAR